MTRLRGFSQGSAETMSGSHTLKSGGGASTYHPQTSHKDQWWNLCPAFWVRKTPDLPDTAEERLLLHALLSERIYKKNPELLTASESTASNRGAHCELAQAHSWTFIELLRSIHSRVCSTANCIALQVTAWVSVMFVSLFCFVCFSF